MSTGVCSESDATGEGRGSTKHSRTHREKAAAVSNAVQLDKAGVFYSAAIVTALAIKLRKGFVLVCVIQTQVVGAAARVVPSRAVGAVGRQRKSQRQQCC
jgi:hypothetical protein